MFNQYTTQKGITVTELVSGSLWIVNNGKLQFKFTNIIDFVRYMTKVK
ncbi:hypothetical protein [Lactococcus allomyrinae]|nr:hypothetical protein [Lactococcus allomyrinae]